MNREEELVARIVELRDRARGAREMANYADSHQAREDDLIRARRLEAEANELESQLMED